MKAAVLSIGTEVTSGEILNRNSMNLSRKLNDVNLDVVCHMSVPDDRQLIFKACDFVFDLVDVVIFTGGLGPTSDDFTREVVSEWLNVDLEFDENVYLELQNKFKKMNRQIKEGHKKECYFFKGANKYDNPAGHALAFSLKWKNKFICLLPGPPNEIEAIWGQGLERDLKDLNSQRSHNLYKFHLIGKGESEIAETTEIIFANSGFSLGYRATIPIVEVKVWVPVGLDALKDEYFKKFNNAFQNYIWKNDFSQKLEEKLNEFKSIYVVDQVTKGLIIEKWLQKISTQIFKKTQFSMIKNKKDFAPDELVLGVEINDKSSWKFYVEKAGIKNEYILGSPYSIDSTIPKFQPYMVEKSSKIWFELL